MAEKIDPWEETIYYDTIKQDLKFEKVTTNGQEINKPPANGKYLKAVLLSDTHDQMQNAKIPDGDILIHAGDFTNAGEESMLKVFDEFLGTLSHKHKLVVAGNHELGFDDSENQANREPMWAGQGTKKGYELLKNGTWLQDKPVEIEGLTFYGASWHPLQGYPFSLVRGPAMEEAWDRMPKKVDVLITHSPPLGYLDTFNAERWGCRHLLKKVKELKPMLHVFGHVHECYGVATDGNTTFVNAALCDKKNQLKNEPFVFYIPIPQ